MKKKKPVSLPVMPVKCATCPFREGSKTEFLRDYLSKASLENARICHSTGRNNAFNKRTGRPDHICRGSRDFQLQIFYRMGFLSAPTDEAWAAKRKELGV
jgi:hypothetical protein